MGKVERKTQIPPLPEVLDRVVRKCAGRLLAHVIGERLTSDRVEQSLHVAEVAIDRRRLHTGRGAHGSGGYGAASAPSEQLSSSFHNACTSVWPTIPR